MGKNVIIFGVDMSTSVHIENKKKDSSILDIGPTQGLDYSTLSTEAQYSINFSLFVNARKMYLFKAIDSEIQIYPLCLRII